MLALGSDLFVIALNLDDLQCSLGLVQQLDLTLRTDAVGEIFLLFGMNVLSHLYELLFVRSEGSLRAFQLFLCLKLFCMLILDSFPDILHLLLAELFAVRLHSDALFFLSSSGPDFNIIDLFVFVSLELLSFFPKNILVDSKDLIIV